MCIKIKDLVDNGQFEIGTEKGIRIIRFDDFEYDYDMTTVYEGKYPYGGIPYELLEHEVTNLNVEDGWLEIEYSGDEYMGPDEENSLITLDKGYNPVLE